MPATKKKLKLGENHRRAVSVLLRQLEQMCGQLETLLVKPSGVLLRMEDDLAAEPAGALRELAGALRAEIERQVSEIELDVKHQSRRAAIRALLSTRWADLEDSKSSGLKGYGKLPAEASAKLDRELDRLMALVEEMITAIETKR